MRQTEGAAEVREEGEWLLQNKGFREVEEHEGSGGTVRVYTSCEGMGLMGPLPTPPLCARHTLSQYALQTPDSDYNKRQLTYQLLMNTAERAHNEMQKWVEAVGGGGGVQCRT